MQGSCDRKNYMNNHSTGRLEVVCGSMFSGKSEELIRRMRRSQLAKRTTQVFKHASDNRRINDNICTCEHVQAHNGDSLEAIAVSTPEQLEQALNSDAQVVGIDEVQFFSSSIVLVIDRLVAEGKRVVVAGLDLDFRGLPFGIMPVLMAMADEVLKLKAVCMQSGRDAHYSQRLVNGRPARHTDPIVLIGAQECYEARARDCYEIDNKPLAEYLQQHFSE